MEQPLRVVPPQEPTHLRENWKLIIGHRECPSRMRAVRVQGGVANVTNGSVLLRTPMPLHDGFYLFNERNELIRQEEVHPWYGYPDPLSCHQPFSKMTPSPKIDKPLVQQFIQYLEMIRQRKVNVVMDKYGVIPVARRGISGSQEELTKFGFGFELPLAGEELVLDPYNLKLALIEMLRYDHCYLSRFHRPDYESPLVLGHDWEHCAVVMPLTRW